MNRLTVSSLALVGALMAGPGVADAQLLWNPLDTKPSPNAIVGFDASVTMRINPNCGSCHGNGSTNTRLYLARNSLLAVASQFDTLFVWGGFIYRGCGSAHISHSVSPNFNNKQASYDALFAPGGMVYDVHNRSCGSKEHHFPGGSLSGTGACLTAGCNPGAEQAVLEAFILSPPAGLDIPTSPVSTSTNCTCKFTATSTVTCVPPPVTSLTPGDEIAFEWVTNYGFPRFDTASGIAADQVNKDFCDPLAVILGDFKTRLDACLNGPDAYWDMSFLGTGWCAPGLLKDSICAPTSALYTTCVCDQSDPGCFSNGIPTSECGLPLAWKARQQVGICHSYGDYTAFGGKVAMGSVFKTQPDNRVNAGGCRENVAMFFTDGAYGGNVGVKAHAWHALDGGDVGGITIPGTGTYMSTDATPIPNMFTFHVSTEFTGSGDAMQNFMSYGAIPNDFDATNTNKMKIAFAEVVNRVLKGTYSGANAALDRTSRAMAFHSFSVFGITDDPAAVGQIPNEKYLGRPSRISIYSYNPVTNSLVANPVCETDWKSVVDDGLLHQPAGGGWNLDVANLSGAVGYGFGSFGNGTPKFFEVNSLGSWMDRDGDDVPDAAPPGSNGFWLGAHLGGTNTQPLWVERPREIPLGANGAGFSAFMNLGVVQSRPRMIYSWSNGYLHAFQAGVPAGGIANPFSGVNESSSYTWSADACKEFWRYRPVNAVWGIDYDYTSNSLIQQPITTGQLAARDVQIAGDGSAAGHYATVLAAAGGPESQVIVMLNVTDPTSPSLLREYVLPASMRAASEPQIYTVSDGVVGNKTAAVIVSSGDNATSNQLRLIPVIATKAVRTVGLPGGAGETYPTSPVCADITGRGSVTHCYVLSNWGRLVRVPLNINAGVAAFGGATDISGPVAGIPNSSLGFYARPVVYFDSYNNVNIAFGSGNIKSLATTSGIQNYFWVVKDEFDRKASGGSATTADVCTPTVNGGNGRFALPTDYHVVSPPIVGAGVVAFTAYHPAANGCSSGDAYLFAMDYETCEDAFNPGASPVASPVSLGQGIPPSPVLVRSTGTIVANTSAKANGAAVAATGANLASQGKRARRLFFRRLISTE